MSVIYKCDGCGKEEIGNVKDGDWFMPLFWVSRYDGFSFKNMWATARPQIHVCSKECAEKCKAFK